MPTPPSNFASNSGLLAVVEDRSVNGFVTTTSNVYSDVNPNALALTFVTPPSGKILFVVSALYFLAPGDGQIRWGIRRSDVAGNNNSQAVQNDSGSFIAGRAQARILVNAATPGVSWTWVWTHANRDNGKPARVGDGAGDDPGPAVMEAWAIPA